ncbi:BREX-2 system adenine-specific DNA-methyltransferase PglX [Streptomyces sp. ok210]|uniref:BREX-2 system adenine-specific DNA-methyltransferase PglX n=1 Tax=Streptomyces sp. ok210 TaxID=1761905 RepID=UPI00210ED144|nr:BREX-2 system adenine-specific DNA-methyltransferase PglX [Streptomyces sp. ok210]
MNQTELLKDLRKQVKALEDDLRERSEDVAEYRAKLEAEYARAREAKRTAATYGAWRDERITQVAAAWVLACVFVRFCEDNRLIADPYLAGPSERLKDAEDRDAEYFRLNPEKNDRDWLVHAFESLAATNPAVADLFDRAHNPLWELAPSYEAASALLKFWRRRGPDGEIVHDFTDQPVVGEDGVVEHEGLSTRFLGDLYQDLSEHARKTYALLQTPEFVEEFILDLTLEPAIKEFGLAPQVDIYLPSGKVRKLPNGLRTIDPTCGSGHFLLGTFKRLLKKWREEEPGTNIWTLIRRASDSVHGCDKNPFAASIARFRLLVAAVNAGGAKQLNRAPGFPINIAVGDSLLHGRGAAGIQGDLLTSGGAFTYSTEDVQEFIERCDLLGKGSYHAVIGNPPYIEVKNDKFEKDNYKRSYFVCNDSWTLAAPFAQRFFELAIRSHATNDTAGFSGQITSNAFMKRNFGKKLIEDFFPTVSLSHVIDTSKAYIPGHNREGTPTVILVGENRPPRRGRPVRTIRGIQPEHATPEDPAVSAAWLAIVDQIGKPGSESDWVSCIDSERDQLSSFPWSLSGGGPQELIAKMEKYGYQLKSRTARIGYFGDTHADEAFTLPTSGPLSLDPRGMHATVSHRGEHVRDWSFSGHDLTALPYGIKKNKFLGCELNSRFIRHFWSLRTELWRRTAFGGGTYRSRGIDWWAWHQLPKDFNAHDWSIVFVSKVSHNHFTLDRDGRAFNRTAPIIKLPIDANEEDHLSLLAILNSSTAGFWMRENAQHQGGGAAAHSWSWTYDFSAKIVGRIPIPSKLPLPLGRAMDSASRDLAAYEPSAFHTGKTTPTRARLDAARDSYTAARESMIALQEELDWEVYGAYCLVQLDDQRLTAPDIYAVPPVKLGERAFEIVLARKVAAGEVETAWFTRHRSTPITEIPAHWPDWYRVIVQNRIDVIEKRKDIALIERPECKRRWASEPWEKREKEALRTWLLDRAEDRRLWFTLRDGFEQPRPLTISQLADELAKLNPEVVSVATLYAADHLGKRDLPLEAVLADVLDAEHLPYLSALRYKDTGLRKRAQWEEVWDLQREEDATGERLNIPVPPKYASVDFAKTSYWSNRGKLDVPKERFVSYPDANPDADPTLLLGWAGWDHRDQAQTVVNLVKDRTSQLSWDNDRIAPLLAGLAELMPWVRQWFGTDDQEWGGNAAEEFGTFLDTERTKRGLTAEQLAAWRPAPKTRGRKAATPRTTKTTDTSAADTQTA